MSNPSLCSIKEPQKYFISLYNFGFWCIVAKLQNFKVNHSISLFICSWVYCMPFFKKSTHLRICYQMLNLWELLLSFVITFIQFSIIRKISESLCSLSHFTACFIFSCFPIDLSANHKIGVLFLPTSVPWALCLSISESWICSHSWLKTNNMKWYFIRRISD